MIAGSLTPRCTLWVKTGHLVVGMSAFTPKVDVGWTFWHVRCVPKAAIGSITLVGGVACDLGRGPQAHNRLGFRGAAF